MIEYLTADAPMWATLALVAGAGTAGRLFGRARRQELAQRAESAERAAGFAVGRARVHQPMAETLVRVIAGSDVPARDHGLPDTVLATTARDAETLLVDFDPLPQASARPELTGTPEEEQRDEDGEQDGTGPPPEPQPAVATAYAAAVLPRYDWPHTGWDPLAGTSRPPAKSPLAGVPGRGWGWPHYLARAWSVVMAWSPAPVRWVRWSLAGWSWRAEARKEARELAQAAQLLGYDSPDEPAVPAVVEPTQVQPRPVPAFRQPATHFYERGKVWARVLLEGWRPCGAEGLHHVEVAAGALGQRQSRLLALPGGTR